MQDMCREVVPLKGCRFNNTNVGLATPQLIPITLSIHTPQLPVYPRLVMSPEEV